MSSRSCTKFVALLFLGLSMAACQDHHWKDYDQIGALPAPEKPFVGAMVSGQVELGDTVKMRNFQGWSLFIVARSAEGASMLAATKETVTNFPLSFAITNKNIMVGKIKQGDKLIVEARLDRDGILDTKDEMTVTGASKAPLELGSDNVLISIDISIQEP